MGSSPRRCTAILQQLVHTDFALCKPEPHHLRLSKQPPHFGLDTAFGHGTLIIATVELCYTEAIKIQHPSADSTQNI